VAEAAPQTGRGIAEADVPTNNPLGTQHTIMTQGYGVGSHAPANIWGAVDLAIDGDGDGQADPKGTLGMPVYATHDGVVQLSSNTWPAGNHIWLSGAHFKTGYSHLQSFAVQDGQSVKRGDVIAYVGSTGESSGPHLDYQVWKDGVNVNPLDYGALDGTK
jgi:murein DD-endopeptidase MepM/ murein hydrolase activator NlpD